MLLVHLSLEGLLQRITLKKRAIALLQSMLPLHLSLEALPCGVVQRLQAKEVKAKDTTTKDPGKPKIRRQKSPRQ